MRLSFRNVFQRNVFLLILDVEQDGVPLIEGPAAAVLSTQANWSTVLYQAGEGEGFGHAVVHRFFADTHLGALLEQLLYFGMNVKIRRISRQPFGELRQLVRGDRSFYFVLRFMAAAKKCAPVIGQLTQQRFLAQATGSLLCVFEFGFDGVGSRSRVFDIHVFGVNLPQRWMVFDGFIKLRLGDGRVIHFAVAVTPVADQIDDYVVGEGVPIVQGHAADSYHRVNVSCIDMKTRNILAARKLRRKTRRVQFGRNRGESDQTIEDHIHRSADAVTGNFGVVKRLGKDALAGKGSVTMD